MKLKWIALAALLATQAHAQSNVSIYGVMDLGYYNVSGDTSRSSGLGAGRNMTSRVGFKGTEDLGGGLQANFVLEGDIAADSGAGVSTPFVGWASTDNKTASANGGFQFNRQSTVGLSGSWGSVTAGRNYTPTFLLDFAYDPFAENGVGASLLTLTSVFFNPAGSVAHLRASNLITYTTPANSTGFNAMLAVAPSETASTVAKEGGVTNAKIGYAKGPLMADVAWGKTKLAATDDITTTSFGTAYDLGTIKPMFEYSRDTVGAAGANAKKQGYLVGATAPVGQGQARISYSKAERSSDTTTTGNVKQLAIGYVYNLSKRTALYGTYSHVSNSNYSNTATAGYAFTGSATSINGNATGYDFGIRTIF